ncbi:MAG: hypothetical protein JW820_01165 [Spirochaetales bacterium]|nr:hypothetical protein [Spirochaetales bacterium]
MSGTKHTQGTSGDGTSQPLIDQYEFELFPPPCIPGADTWSARVPLAVDIEPVFPYLNARLEKADYDRAAKVLIWKNQGQSFAFRPREIKAAPARDREEARRLVDKAVALVNDTWRERDAIQPDHARRNPPNLAQTYRLLPRTNCGKCGFATCMAFAAALREGRAKLSSCPVLEEPAYRDNRGSLAELLEAVGA